MSTSKIKTVFKSLMGLQDSPMKVAVSFGFGTLIAFSPLVGLHTVLVLVTAVVFKLNKVAVLTGVYINNPLTFIPISTFCTWVGVKILGMDAASVHLDFSNLTMSNVMTVFGSLLRPFILGSAFVAVIAGGLSFFIILYIFRLKNRLQKTEADNIESEKTQDCQEI
ncbi:MAG: DUF2062 domain-containing protein [Nitrospirae bacterium]|nr:DUF2062 domain-containing protein [Nitrospirota bacterium]